MGTFIHTQNSFSSGEISPEFFAKEHATGLSKLTNMDVLSSGGISRRPGLLNMTQISNGARLVPFSVSESENFMLALTGGHVQIFNQGTRVKDLISPWGAADLTKLQYAQRFGTMIFVHPDYAPQVLRKVGTTFEMNVFGFSSNDDMSVNIPFMKFDDCFGIKIKITTSALGNTFATMTADSNAWTADSVGARLFLMGKQWVVYQYISEKVIIASTNNTYTVPGASVSDWSESAFGKRRGWPCSISFHQDRLVFGGSRDWPSGIWMSKVGNHNNFSSGTGLDDDAIFLTLLSEQRQQICTVVSSDNLQILTTAGEWAISNKPLTPSSVNIKQHTSIGSVSSRYLAPQKIAGSTVFIANSEKDIRELTLDALGETYNAKDLCAISKHLMKTPVDVAYNNQTNQLFIVMSDGFIAVLNINTTLQISAWGTYETNGLFKSVAVLDGETFVCVMRDGITYIEKFSKTEMVDNKKYGFSFVAAGMPILVSNHTPKKIKLRKITARLLNTKSLFINSFRAPLPNGVYSDSSNGFSGDVSINLIGTENDTIKPAWKISSSESLPATMLSISLHGWYLI